MTHKEQLSPEQKSAWSLLLGSVLSSHFDKAVDIYMWLIISSQIEPIGNVVRSFLETTQEMNPRLLRPGVAYQVLEVFGEKPKER